MIVGIEEPVEGGAAGRIRRAISRQRDSWRQPGTGVLPRESLALPGLGFVRMTSLGEPLARHAACSLGSQLYTPGEFRDCRRDGFLA